MRYAKLNDKTQLKILQYFQISNEEILASNYWPYAQKYGLTMGEALAINKYTDKYYLKINEVLRQDKQLTHSEQLSFNAINGGIEKLKKHKGLCLRGTFLTIEQIRKYSIASKTSKVIIENGYISSTLDATVADNFVNNAIFNITSKNGRILGDLAHYSDEKEVLFKAGSKFRVKEVTTSKFEDGTELTRILMEEL